MDVVTLFLILVLLNSLDSGSAQVSPTVVPNRSQFFTFEHFSVSCQHGGQREEDEEDMTGWRVMKKMKDGKVAPCPCAHANMCAPDPPPSSCSITVAYTDTDSGVYWCQTGLGETSNTVNITVIDGSVILESPALPVMEGDDVTLSCTPDAKMLAGNVTADFYKDGFFIERSSTGNMILQSVSTSEEGLYMCRLSGFGESPESLLTVIAPPAGQDPSVPLLSVSTLVRHLVVGTPYLLSTILLGLIYRDRARAQHASKGRQTCNDVIMETAA